MRIIGIALGVAWLVVGLTFIAISIYKPEHPEQPTSVAQTMSVVQHPQNGVLKENITNRTLSPEDEKKREEFLRTLKDERYKVVDTKKPVHKMAVENLDGTINGFFVDGVEVNETVYQNTP